MAQHFIQGAIKHPGALHRELGIPQGQTIPHGTLQHAAQAGGKLGERARFAETLEHLPHRAMGGPVMPHQNYMVGERGPEVFRPKVPGAIHPIGGMKPMGAPMGVNPLQQRLAILKHLGGLK